jgi:arginase
MSQKSMFGINDCHRVRKNTKKSYTFGKRLKKTKTMKLRPMSKNKFKHIILFSHKLGQTKPGVDKTPVYMKSFINPKNHKIINVKSTGDMFKNIQHLYKANKKCGKRPIVNIGGDHSMAIATIAHTLNEFPNAKVLYFDAHGDINTFASSKSKHYHGMPLSFITGLDHDTRFSFIKNKLSFDNLCYFGTRCLDPAERDVIYDKNIKYVESSELNEHINEVIQKVDNFIGDSPVHLSFDVDSVDPSFIPSTGTSVKHGIRYSIAIQMLNYLYTKNIVM